MGVTRPIIAATLSLLFSATEVSAATCATDGSDYEYSETISGGLRSVTVSWCPNHAWKKKNPNNPVAAPGTVYKVPSDPMLEPNALLGTAVSKDLSAQGGNAGVMRSGSMLFSPYGGGKYGTVTGYSNSAVSAESDTFDACGGHASSNSAASYHIHSPPPCLIAQLKSMESKTNSDHSPQIGWAADGFPVYGPRGPGGILMRVCTTSGDQNTGNKDTPCVNSNGALIAELSAVDKFKVRYYLLGEEGDGSSCSNPICPIPGADYHPSTPLAYYGCCPSGSSCSANFLPTCTSSAVAGTVSGYDASTDTIKTALPINVAGNGQSSASACSASDLKSFGTCSTISSYSSPSPSSSPSPNPSPSPSPPSTVAAADAAVTSRLPVCLMLSIVASVIWQQCKMLGNI